MNSTRLTKLCCTCSTCGTKRRCTPPSHLHLRVRLYRPHHLRVRLYRIHHHHGFSRLPRRPTHRRLQFSRTWHSTEKSTKCATATSFGSILTVITTWSKPCRKVATLHMCSSCKSNICKMFKIIFYNKLRLILPEIAKLQTLLSWVIIKNGNTTDTSMWQNHQCILTFHWYWLHQKASTTVDLY